MTNRAIIEIVNVKLKNAVKISSADNIRSAQCINKEATSAKLRCSLSSNLINLKSVSNFALDFTDIEFPGINSELKINLNTDYLLQSDSGIGKLLLLDYRGTWYMNEKTIDSISFESDKVPNNNMLDAIIPPSSCFGMKMTETIEKYKVPFEADAKIAVYSEAGDRYVGTPLSNIAAGIKYNVGTLENKLIKLPLTGYLEINVIGADHNEIVPCIDG